MKSNKASKDEITAAVNVLLELKAKYKAATGQDWKPSGDPKAGQKKEAPKKKEENKKKEKSPKKEVKKEGKK